MRDRHLIAVAATVLVACGLIAVLHAQSGQPVSILQGGNTATVSAGGALKVDGSAAGGGSVTQGTSPWVVSASGSFPVTGTFWQTTQPVSGTFWQTTQPVSIATMPTTPVTGTFWQATQPVSGTFFQATQPVSGTFWQATQPVSGTFWQATQPISGSVTATQATGTNLHAVLDTTSTTAVTQATGTNLHAVIDTGSTTAVTYATTGSGTSTGALRVELPTNGTGAVGLNAGTAIIGAAYAQPDSSGTYGTSSTLTTSLEASHVVKASAGTLYLLTCFSTRTSAQYIQMFNSTTVPADATAVTLPPIYCPATSNCSWSGGTFGHFFATGISWANSSTATTKTVGSADTWCEAEYK